MKRYSTIYYLLFVLIVMGAFASMAQNAYGIKLMGYVCLGFSLSLLHEIIFYLPHQELLTKTERQFAIVENGMLSLVGVIFFFRLSLISMPGVLVIFSVSLLFLLIIYAYQATVHFKRTQQHDKQFAVGIGLYYITLLIFIATFLIGTLHRGNPVIHTVAGLAGLLAFVLIGLRVPKIPYQDTTISFFQYLFRMRNKSVMVMIGFALIFSYFRLSSMGVLPKLYSGEMPSGYYKLVKDAEGGNERNSPQSKEKFLEFKEAYSKFIERYP